jgi:CheY-like chemotaxis protein
MVLYIEDQPVNVLLMQAVFDRRPALQLVVATTGQDALTLAEDLHPALLLVDMRLPDCHGLELLPQLRRICGCESVPAVAVTADHHTDLEGSSFVELWGKPLNLGRVLERLDALTDPGRAGEIMRQRDTLQHPLPPLLMPVGGLRTAPPRQQPLPGVR